MQRLCLSLSVSLFLFLTFTIYFSVTAILLHSKTPALEKDTIIIHLVILSVEVADGAVYVTRVGCLCSSPGKKRQDSVC